MGGLVSLSGHGWCGHSITGGMCAPHGSWRDVCARFMDHAVACDCRCPSRARARCGRPIAAPSPRSLCASDQRLPLPSVRRTPEASARPRPGGVQGSARRFAGRGSVNIFSSATESEKDADLVQKLGLLQPFIAVFPQDHMANSHLLDQPSAFLA